MGDVILSLPFIKQMGGAKILYLEDFPEYFFNKEAHNFLIPLLKAQDFIGEIRTWSGEEVDYDLDKFRSIMNVRYHGTLAGSYFEFFEKPNDVDFHNKPWIEIPDMRLAMPFDGITLVSRTIYLHDREQKNQFYVDLLADQNVKPVFVGTMEEHSIFMGLYGQIPYYPLNNALELALILKHSGHLVANQSLIYAVAEALKIKVHLEKRNDAAKGDCMFERENLHYI